MESSNTRGTIIQQKHTRLYSGAGKWPESVECNISTSIWDYKNLSLGKKKKKKKTGNTETLKWKCELWEGGWHHQVINSNFLIKA